VQKKDTKKFHRNFRYFCVLRDRMKTIYSNRGLSKLLPHTYFSFIFFCPNIIYLLLVYFLGSFVSYTNTQSSNTRLVIHNKFFFMNENNKKTTKLSKRNAKPTRSGRAGRREIRIVKSMPR